MSSCVCVCVYPHDQEALENLFYTEINEPERVYCISSQVSHPPNYPSVLCVPWLAAIQLDILGVELLILGL